MSADAQAWTVQVVWTQPGSGVRKVSEVKCMATGQAEAKREARVAWLDTYKGQDVLYLGASAELDHGQTWFCGL